ncbi:MAG TPA: DUF2071 domain-containing protein [Planctomycetota bacterium]|nr:DUF2071 domain-containing protein [Planctomycetota bacterium]
MDTAALLAMTAHRPWPLPARPWALQMAWHELLFLHWPVAAALLQPLLPPSLTVEEFDGTAWLGVVPFRMAATRLRWLPPLPGARAFPELNVRTYVRGGGRSGVWFFSLDADSRLAVCGARAWFRLPYFLARMHCERLGDELHYRSERTHRGAPTATFAARWRVNAPFAGPAQGSLATFLTERYCLFTTDRAGQLCCGDVHHRPWQLAPAEVELQRCTMTEQLALALPQVPPLALAARTQEVLAWSPRRWPPA